MSSGDTSSDDALNHKKGHDAISFKMVASAVGCLKKATARVTVRSLGPVEKMHVEVDGLPPDADFDFFVIQVPKMP